MVLSIPGSVYPGLSFSFLVNDHLKTFLMMLVVISSIRGLPDVERLIVAHVGGAAVYCIKILTTFTIEEGGQLGELFYYDSNDLAMLIACTLPMAIYFIVIERTKLLAKALFGVSAIIFLVTIVQTGSRGGFLGLLAVGIYMLLGFRAVKARVRLGVVAASVVVFSMVAGPQYWTQMGTMLNSQEDYNFSGTDDDGRGEIWKRGMGYMADNPFLGVGANAFPVAEGTISDLADRQNYGIGLKWSAAHNSFIQIGAELGIPGLIGFLMLLWHLIKANLDLVKAAGARGGGRDEAFLAQALLGSLVGYVVAGFFLSQAYSAFLYSVAAIIVGLALTATPVPVARLGDVERGACRTQSLG